MAFTAKKKIEDQPMNTVQVRDAVEQPPQPQQHDEFEQPKIERRGRPRKVVEEPTPLWTVREVPTSTEQIIYNEDTGESLDILSALVRILNDLEDLE